MTFEIVKINKIHISKVVDVHLQTFPNFFLTFLGPKFLREFYNSFSYDPTGIGFVAEDAETGDTLGVIVGPLVADGYFKRLLKRRWWAFCLASVAAVLKRPSQFRINVFNNIIVYCLGCQVTIRVIQVPTFQG